jgi:hypothetical protein
MTTHIAPSSTLPFQLGEPRSFRGLTTIPLFSADEPRLEYIGLDEAVARGLEIAEVGSEGIVGLVAVSNQLDDHVLLHEGEELVGAKQNRILGQTILVEAKSTLKVPATCVERGRWSHRSERFAPAPRAAYPALRKAQRLGGQAAAWADISAKSAILDASSRRWSKPLPVRYLVRGRIVRQSRNATPVGVHHVDLEVLIQTVALEGDLGSVG